MDTRAGRPEIEFLILADRVEAINGKLYVMGGAWDRLQIADFGQPVSFGLAVGVLVPWGQTNQEHPLHIYVEHEDGTVIPPDIQARVNMGRPPIAVLGQSFRALIAVNGVWKLPGPGTYRVQASIGDREPKRTVFHAEPARRVAAR